MAPKVITCSICDRPFSKRFSLNRHMASMHHIKAQATRRSILCPVSECGSMFPYHDQLRAHLKEAHEVTLDDIEINFNSMDAFFDWKQREEESFMLKYVKACGTQRLTDGIEVYRYYCYRTGLYKPEGKGLGKLKSQGSCKIGASCPSTITAHKAIDGRVTVRYCMTHVGHDLSSEELKRDYNASVNSGNFNDTKEDLTNKKVEVKPSKVTQAMLRFYQLFSEFDVSTEDRFVISRALAQEKHTDEVFNCIRKSVNSQMDREYESFVNNLQKLHCCSFDDKTTDFQQLTDKCNASEDIPVIYYEGLLVDEEETASDTFILVVMNSDQVKLLKRFGQHGTVCLDPIYSQDSSSYIAIVLYVLSPEFGWLMCGICFCQSCNSMILKAFFSQVLARTGTIQVRTLISEDLEVIHNAWVEVMGDVSEWILSPWHIDYKLRQKLKSLVFTDDGKLACLYRLVRSLLETTSEEKFNEHLSFLAKKSSTNVQMATFNKFLNDGYIWRKYSWAKYCRDEHERKTLNSAEACHLLSRRVCHGEGLNLGQTLFTLFHFHRVACLKAMFHLSQNSSEVSSLTPITCPDLFELGDVYVTRLENQNFWTLQIGESTFDIVHTGKKCSPSCSLKCTDCQVCLHKYRCSCVESCIQWKFCKHIHLIGHHLGNSGELNEIDEGLESTDDEVIEDAEDNALEQEDNEESFSCPGENAPMLEGESELIKEESLSESGKDLELCDNDSLVQQIQLISQAINKCATNISNLDNLKALHKTMKATYRLAQSFSSENGKAHNDEFFLSTLKDHNYTM